MGKESEPVSYRSLARVYDDLFGAFRGPADAARNRILRKILPRVEAACDLACGTGTTAVALALTGISMYAVDRSPEMCRLTREKAARARLAIRVIRSDMRDFELPAPVDLITCEFDAINHVERKSDLLKVAKAVARALRPGGHFLFDANNSLGFARYWTGNAWMERPGIVVVMRNGHSDTAQRAWSDIEIFVREGSLWRRHQERVDEVCWSADEVRRALSKAGFDQVSEWDAASFFGRRSIIAPGCRSWYLARKSALR